MIRDTHKQTLWDETSRIALIQEVLKKGHITLEHFFDDESEQKLFKLREVIGPKNAKNEQLAGTFGGEVRTSDEIFEMCQLIYKTRCTLLGEPYAPLNREKQSVGVAFKSAAQHEQNHETEYHYDAAYINIVIPISLPPHDGSDGNLVLFPNIRRTYPRIIAAPLSSLLRRIPFMRKLYGYSIVDYSTGSMHLFFGDISLHGVEPIVRGERMIMAINSHW